VLASPRWATQRRRWAAATYPLPEEPARHAPRQLFAPDEPRGACHEAGEGLGRQATSENSVNAKFNFAEFPFHALR
jgi:hypothetical protein